MSLDEILADVKKEGSDPFAQLDKESPSESPAEIKPEVITKELAEEGKNTPEDNVPFHKHPRWIERESELKTLKESGEATARELAELKAFKEATVRKEVGEVDPDFKALWGDNPEAYAKWLSLENKRKDELKREILEDQQKVVEQQKAETQKWNKWVDDEVNKLQSEGNTFDRNELIKTMLEYRPTDENGNFDFKLGFKIYQNLHKEDPAKSIARKELADTTTRSSSRGEGKKKDYQTSNDLRHRSWHSL